MRGELGGLKTVLLGERRPGLLQREAERIGAAVKMLDGARLALDPARVVGRGAVEREIEELAAERAHVDHDGRIARQRHLAQLRADLPCMVGMELREHERALLMRNGLQNVWNVHERATPFACTWIEWARGDAAPHLRDFDMRMRCGHVRVGHEPVQMRLRRGCRRRRYHGDEKQKARLDRAFRCDAGRCWLRG